MKKKVALDAGTDYTDAEIEMGEGVFWKTLNLMDIYAGLFAL